jgi:hypothetical protein
MTMTITTRQRPVEEAPTVEAVPPKQVRAAARSRELVDLMRRRPDLAGVYPPADVAAEAIRWSA